MDNGLPKAHSYWVGGSFGDRLLHITEIESFPRPQFVDSENVRINLELYLDGVVFKMAVYGLSQWTTWIGMYQYRSITKHQFDCMRSFQPKVQS